MCYILCGILRLPASGSQAAFDWRLIRPAVGLPDSCGLEKNMSFDIHQLDQLDEWDEGAFEEYQDALLDLFLQSEEGQMHLQQFPEADAGFWASQLVRYGYNYLGITLPKMTRADVEEIVTELFPRKISLLEPDDADDAIPELIAFWQYLKREYALRQADAIIKLLQRIAPDFVRILNDPARFGMAKSFVMMGHSAGFDMTNEEDINEFMHLYNDSLASGANPAGRVGASREGRQQAERAKRKKKRKAAKAARKRRRGK
jgi:hypothetical protein